MSTLPITNVNIASAPQKITVSSSPISATTAVQVKAEGLAVQATNPSYVAQTDVTQNVKVNVSNTNTATIATDGTAGSTVVASGLSISSPNQHVAIDQNVTVNNALTVQTQVVPISTTKSIATIKQAAPITNSNNMIVGQGGATLASSLNSQQSAPINLANQGGNLAMSDMSAAMVLNLLR